MTRDTATATPARTCALRRRRATPASARLHTIAPWPCPGPAIVHSRAPRLSAPGVRTSTATALFSPSPPTAARWPWPATWGTAEQGRRRPTRPSPAAADGPPRRAAWCPVAVGAQRRASRSVVACAAGAALVVALWRAARPGRRACSVARKYARPARLLLSPGFALRSPAGLPLLSNDAGTAINDGAPPGARAQPAEPCGGRAQRAVTDDGMTALRRAWGTCQAGGFFGRWRARRRSSRRPFPPPPKTRGEEQTAQTAAGRRGPRPAPAAAARPRATPSKPQATPSRPLNAASGGGARRPPDGMPTSGPLVGPSPPAQRPRHDNDKPRG